MIITGRGGDPELHEVYGEIRRLGLVEHLAELEAFGYTVVEGALSDELTSSLRDTIVRIVEERSGRTLDVERETDYSGMAFQPYLLFADPVFKQAVLNPAPLALITYLLGRHCVLSSLGCHLKGPGGHGLVLHSDQANGVPQPFPAMSLVANCNYALTDYTLEAGALAMVPGSHRRYRQPTRQELRLDSPEAIPVEVPAGSAVIWHGATWHGSYPRQIPGLRINLSTFFCRPHLLAQENYRDHLPPGYLDGEDPRLGRLLGTDLAYGWTEDGPTKPFAPQHSWLA
ncbi:MAG: phytanoyl-CoA dioxygenase family protein [Acidimicrobiales bacterium]